MKTHSDAKRIQTFSFQSWWLGTETNWMHNEMNWHLKQPNSEIKTCQPKKMLESSELWSEQCKKRRLRLCFLTSRGHWRASWICQAVYPDGQCPAPRHSGEMIKRGWREAWRREGDQDDVWCRYFWQIPLSFLHTDTQLPTSPNIYSLIILCVPQIPLRMHWIINFSCGGGEEEWCMVMNAFCQKR